MTDTHAHDETLGERLASPSGLIVVNATRYRNLQECPRRAFLHSVLRLGGDDELGERAAHGVAVHAELHARHADPTKHDHESMVDPEGNGDPAIVAAARAHAAVCPGADATYLGGEIDLRWYLLRKLVLVTGRVDALWQHPDGTLEVRDYKTGHVPATLEDDVGALLYLLLAAAHPSRPRHVRVAYEVLHPEGARLLELDGTRAHLEHARDLVEDYAQRLRRERVWAANPSPAICGRCSYTGDCPHADGSARHGAWG